MVVTAFETHRFLICANMVVGEGKRGRGCVLATPARECLPSGSTPKNGTSKVSRKPIQTSRLRDKRVPFLEAPPE